MKFLLLGDNEHAVWHPLRGVDDAVRSALHEHTVTVREDYPSLTLTELQTYDAIINYMDAWSKRGSDALAGAMLGYVAGGGAMLTLHNGIITRSHPALEQMHGASFTGHPEHEELRYETREPHPTINGVEPFAIDEEPYRFTMDPLTQLTMLMEYAHQGEWYPAAWLRLFGLGRVCYVSVGHTADSLVPTAVQKLLRQCAEWCVGTR